jgi:hypothetical protein
MGDMGMEEMWGMIRRLLQSPAVKRFVFEISICKRCGYQRVARSRFDCQAFQSAKVLRQ